jgi:gamma-glutamyltranspeptidase/glutathione hydrolase
VRGVVAAGHPLTAEAGAEALRAGGNAVDAALAAMMASFAAEPLLTGMGAGGYMLVAPPGEEAVLLDFIVEAPGRGADPGARAELVPVSVSFGEAVQVFNAGAASCGTYGNPSGICEAHRRFARLPLRDLAEPAIRLAREGVAINAQQAFIFELLGGIIALTEESRELYWVDGRAPREGDVLREPALADALELLATEGEEPFYRGDVAAALCTRVTELGGLLTPADFAAYVTVARRPVRIDYRGHEVLTNPPPSAGGILIAAVLARLAEEDGPPGLGALVGAMEDAQGARTEEFHEGLSRDGFMDEFLSVRLGNTTHISVMDAEGWACSVTATNGACSGIVVPGTGIHLNNMMGEADLNPLGFFKHPPGRRLPSMMAPTVVRRGGRPELVLGSAGSNRIRSAITQVVSNVIDRGMDAGAAVVAPRVHWEDGVVYVEPGLDVSEIEAEGRPLARFARLNVFFGGVQAVQTDGDALTGAADPRRGGAAVIVE